MNLEKMINDGNFNKVIEFFNNKKEKSESDYLFAAIAYYNLNQKNKAIGILKELLKINPNNLDALFNLSSIYYKTKNWNKLKETALTYYKNDPNDWAINDMLADLFLFEGHFDKSISFLEKAFNNANQGVESYFKEKIQKFKNKLENAKKLPKLAFICAKGLDNFINDIIEGLSDEYWVRKFIVTKNEEIYQAIDWADIVWFEWANEVAIIGSYYQKLIGKPAIIRLHSYESLSYYPTKINWNNIDKLILVADHIKDIIRSYIPNIENMVDIEIVHNGIKLDTIKFKKREKGFNIAWVAHISHKKNPPMMLQIIKKLVEKDKRYKLHIAGDFQDLRYEIYLKHMIKEMGLENNVIFYGWVDDMEEWWEDKNYLLSTSIHEGHPYNVIEGMAKGIKPIIHNYYGSKNQWPNDLIFNSVDEAANLVIETKYESEKYRDFIENNYYFKKMLNNIKKIIHTLSNKKNDINKMLELSYKNPENFKNNEYIFNYYLDRKEIKNFMEFTEYLLINGRLELKKKIDYFLRNLYYKFESYERFEYLSDKPFIYLEKEGEKYLNKYYNKYFLSKKEKDEKIHFLYILNGLDYFQILFRFVFESIINSHNENIEYHILSLLDENSFNNAEYAKKILAKNNIDFFIPSPSENMEDRIIQYYKYIAKVNPDISFYQSFYLAPYGILVYPLLKKVSKIIGRHITQDIEPYFDNKVDFVYTGLKDKNIFTKNIFFKLPPVNSELINKNKDIKKDYKIFENNKVIISIGRAVKYYNKHYWNVVKKLSDDIENITFVYFGPNYEGIFKEYIPQKYIYNKKIMLLGADLNARAYLKSCDYYINSAPNGSGISFNEAYYANLPIITFVKDYDYTKKSIENRVNSLPLMFYKDALKIFPKLGDYEELYQFAKKIIIDENFKNFVQSKRKIKNKDLEYKSFVGEFENFVIKLLKKAGNKS
ncbi:hypothetical protein JCM30566_09700 [Marinitoga arctica]